MVLEEVWCLRCLRNIVIVLYSCKWRQNVVPPLISSQHIKFVCFNLCSQEDSYQPSLWAKGRVWWQFLLVSYPAYIHALGIDIYTYMYVMYTYICTFISPTLTIWESEQWEEEMKKTKSNIVQHFSTSPTFFNFRDVMSFSWTFVLVHYIYDWNSLVDCQYSGSWEWAQSIRWKLFRQKVTMIIRVQKVGVYTNSKMCIQKW